MKKGANIVLYFVIISLVAFISLPFVLIADFPFWCIFVVPCLIISIDVLKNIFGGERLSSNESKELIESSSMKEKQDDDFSQNNQNAPTKSQVVNGVGNSRHEPSQHTINVEPEIDDGWNDKHDCADINDKQSAVTTRANRLIDITQQSFIANVSKLTKCINSELNEEWRETVQQGLRGILEYADYYDGLLRRFRHTEGVVNDDKIDFLKESADEIQRSIMINERKFDRKTKNLANKTVNKLYNKASMERMRGNNDIDLYSA